MTLMKTLKRRSTSRSASRILMQLMINEAMEETLSRRDNEKLKLTETDLKIMVNVIPTLDILSDAISVLGGEKYCTGSNCPSISCSTYR